MNPRSRRARGPLWPERPAAGAVCRLGRRRPARGARLVRRSRRPVTQVFRGKLAATMELATAAGLVAVTLGITLGTFAGSRPRPTTGSPHPYLLGEWLEHAGFLVRHRAAHRVLGLSGLVPVGRSDPAIWASSAIHRTLHHRLAHGRELAGVQGCNRHLVLPAITLGLATTAIITRTMRSSLVEELNEDYVDAARAKGLPSVWY